MRKYRLLGLVILAGVPLPPILPGLIMAGLITTALTLGVVHLL